jgi:hypothetical protein
MMMTLPDYIAAVGDDRAARLFRVTERTAQSWRLGTRLPRPAKAVEIVKRTKGRVSLAGIFAQ